jgi:hypothetical protein
MGFSMAGATREWSTAVTIFVGLWCQWERGAVASGDGARSSNSSALSSYYTLGREPPGWLEVAQ